MEQITIKEVAKLCGVGVSTVSRAINNHPDINEATKQKILKIIKEYHYIPNNSAQNLKRSDSRTIALLIKGLSNPFFTEMIQVFEQELNKKNYSFVLQHVEETEDELDVALRLEKEKRLKGIVFLGSLYRHTEEKLNQLTVPFLVCTMDASNWDAGYPCVTVDDEKESWKMVDYLCRCGHKRIAILTGIREDASVSMLRFAGYKRALREHGLPFDEKLVVQTRSGVQTHTMENGYRLAKELLDSGAEFTCIYAISDSMAVGACKALFDAGKRVPEDCSVAGFDGVEISEYYEPSITTICQPRRQMAQAAVRLMFDLIRKKPVEEKQVFEAKLLERDSVKKLEADWQK